MKLLRALLVFSTVWMLASGAFVSASFADISSVTPEQVSNVCGKDLTGQRPFRLHQDLRQRPLDLHLRLQPEDR